MLGDDHSHMGGSGDMKSDVVMVKIWDFIFMFLCLDMVLYILGYYTFYMSRYLVFELSQNDLIKAVHLQ